MTLKDKYRFVKSYGTITRKRINYIFTADPFKSCPVIHAENKSRWGLTEIVYHLINELT